MIRVTFECDPTDVGALLTVAKERRVAVERLLDVVRGDPSATPGCVTFLAMQAGSSPPGVSRAPS